jgi:hypothetical protein
MPIVESLHQETSQAEASQIEVHESEIQVPIAKKRGRKPKLVAPIDNSNPMGRPPLARNALANYIEVGVVLRRSNRKKTLIINNFYILLKLWKNYKNLC